MTTTMLFCIVGTGRCGSTLLWEMLDRHPDVFVFRESHWIPKMVEFFGLGRADVSTLTSIVLRTTHVDGTLVLSWSARELQALFSDRGEMTVTGYCDRLGLALAARAGKRCWADKTPDYGPYMELLQRLWPACRFVHLIRDGVAVIGSMAAHPGYQWLAAADETWWVPPSFNGYHRAVSAADAPLEAYAALWERRLRRIRDEAERLRPDSYVEIRFEDLLEAPERVLNTLAAFVGLDAPAAWLSSAVAAVSPTRVRSKRTDAIARVMSTRQRQLLVELGYPPV